MRPLFFLIFSPFLLFLSISRISDKGFRRRRGESLDAQPSCDCYSRKYSKSFNFCYTNPRSRSTLKGIKFDCQFMPHLEDLDLLEPSGPFRNLADRTPSEDSQVVVTAFSDDHYASFVKSYKAFRIKYPSKKWIVYGLKLSDSNAEKLKSQSESGSENLEFRKFDVSRYPSHVAIWTEYRFKFLIIAEVLKEYQNVWWTDAHHTILEDNFMEVLYENLSSIDNPSSIWSNVFTGHSNYAVLNPGVLTYLPVPRVSILKRERQLGANSMYFARTPESLEIVKWMSLCSLEKDCMAPPGSKIRCGFAHDQFGKWANCFRFDQSVLNILLLNLHGSHHKFESPLAKQGQWGRV